MSNSRCAKMAEVGIRRRDFLVKAGMLGAAISSVGLPVRAVAGGLSDCPIAVFSKIYQELKLDFEAAAGLTAEAGLDGIDCPVRSGGEIEPEEAADHLPKYAEILGRKKLRLQLLTSGITKVRSPHAEEILRSAKGLGVRYYRLGFFEREKPSSSSQQVKEIRSALKDVAAMNKAVGICGLFQNHSGSFGANLADLREVVSEFDPDQIGVAFDIGHALMVHGKDWVGHFEGLKNHLRVVYIKDARQGKGWVRFGEGEIAQTDYFERLGRLGYQAPISLHIEFDWSNQGKNRDRATLLKSLRDSATVLRRWLTKG